MALEWGQRVQTCGEQALDGVGELGGPCAAFLGEALDHLLGEQRIALGSLGERL